MNINVSRLNGPLTVAV
jgi:aquaporin related protein